MLNGPGNEQINFEDMTHKGRFIINYVHNGDCKIVFLESLLQFQEFDSRGQNLREGFCGAGGHFTTANRNEAVELFLKRPSKPEWAFFIDTDIRFEPWMIYQLYQDADAIERPIVSGVYCTYIEDTFAPIFFSRAYPGTEFEEYRTLPTIQPGLQELEAIGMGACIIH